MTDVSELYGASPLTENANTDADALRAVAGEILNDLVALFHVPVGAVIAVDSVLVIASPLVWVDDHFNDGLAAPVMKAGKGAADESGKLDVRTPFIELLGSNSFL